MYYSYITAYFKSLGRKQAYPKTVVISVQFLRLGFVYLSVTLLEHIAISVLEITATSCTQFVKGLAPANHTLLRFPFISPFSFSHQLKWP